MSLILEALNKADRERDNQPVVPDLQTIHGRIVPPAPPKRHWGVYVIIALLVLILFLLIALLVRQSKAPATPTSIPATAAASPVAPAPPAASTTLPTPPAQPDQTAVADSPNDVHDIYQDANTLPPLPEYNPNYEDTPAPAARTKKSRSRLLDELETQAQALDEANNGQEEEEEILPASVRKAKPKVEQPEDPSVLDEQRIKELWEQTKKEVPDRPSNSNARLETQIKEAIKDSLSLYKQIPFLHELPERVQNSVPSINYVNHLYSEKAGGAVIINKKTLKAGQEIAPGLLIDRVASDGIIVQYQGTRFKLNALSSWVNFSNKPAAETGKAKK